MCKNKLVLKFHYYAENCSESLQIIWSVQGLQSVSARQTVTGTGLFHSDYFLAMRDSAVTFCLQQV